MKLARYLFASLFLLLACSAVLPGSSRAAGVSPGAWVLIQIPDDGNPGTVNTTAALIQGQDESATWLDLAWVDPDPAHAVNGKAPLLTAESVPPIDLLIATAFAVRYHIPQAEAEDTAIWAETHFACHIDGDQVHGYLERMVMGQYTPRDPPTWPPSGFSPPPPDAGP